MVNIGEADTEFKESSFKNSVQKESQNQILKNLIKTRLKRINRRFRSVCLRKNRRD